MRKTGGSVKLLVLWGQEMHKPGWDIVRALLGGLEKPRIAWCEPTPRAERLKDFPGLWLERISGLADRLASDKLLLDEVRLFWDDSWVHLVIEPGRVRWAVFQTSASQNLPNMPNWVSLLGEPADTQNRTWEVEEQDRALLLMGPRDLLRYGLSQIKDTWKTARHEGDFPTLRVKEYRQGAALVGWRLEVS